MDLTSAFQNWDGKTVADLRCIADQLVPADHPALLAACRSNDPLIARAASWVLKAAYEDGAMIPFPTDLLVGNPHWEIALHLLQSIQHCAVDMPPEVVRPYLTHHKPMIRAWALDAAVRLGAPDADELRQAAADDPAASVRARARNLQKQQ